MPFIEGAVSTALACQDVAEIVVQDAKSTDGTTDALARLADERILVVTEPDSGQADALNRALARASQPWLLWLNADDIVIPDAIARLAATTRTTDADVIYGDFCLIRDDGSIMRTQRAPASVDALDLFVSGTSIFSGSMLIKSNVLSHLGGFDEGLSYCMDYDLLLRLALTHSFRYVPGVAAALRMHASSKSFSEPWGFLTEHRRVQRRYRSHFTTGASARAHLGTARMTALLATTRVRYSRPYSALRQKARP